jgi:hypothetical protein
VLGFTEPVYIYLAGAEALNNALLHVAPAKQSITTGGRKILKKEKKGKKTTQKPTDRRHYRGPRNPPLA